ncbi:hypothetical protein RAS1_19040 [Phycisphaerae bacterium RAS1]|nr:hypothetical protein RAS1_19040 [Phycisphaerae bacterium RAS1]
MSTPRENLGRLLQGDAAALDSLTPDEIHRIEALLAEDSVLAEQAATATPPLDVLAGRVALPQDAQWERVWANIHRASHAKARRPRFGWRIATPLLAAAACLMLLAAWPRSVATLGGAQLARQVIIDELETYGGASSLVLTTGEDDAVSIIWVVDESS